MNQELGTITAHVLVFQDNKVLLVRHGENAGHINDTYGIPGGHLNPNETLSQTAAREFQEETGLVVSPEDLDEFPGNIYTADILRKDGITRRYTMHVFRGRRAEGILTPNEETIPEWVDLDNLDRINLLPNVKNAIQAAKEYKEAV